MLAKRFEEARISEVMQPTEAQIVNPAVEPEERIRPRRTLNVAIAAILGLFCGLGAAFFLEYMNRTIRTAEDVRDYLNLPVLGAIPDVNRTQAKAGSGELATTMARLRGLFGAAKRKGGA